ncbi:hypothetical protein HOM50_02415 [bacterium]|jgi:hypothetical protein|nr:hypothetical protein [bacterium]MBT5015237.1 hypothetical protein [bacterium]
MKKKLLTLTLAAFMLPILGTKTVESSRYTPVQTGYTSNTDWSNASPSTPDRASVVPGRATFGNAEASSSTDIASVVPGYSQETQPNSFGGEDTPLFEENITTPGNNHALIVGASIGVSATLLLAKIIIEARSGSYGIGWKILKYGTVGLGLLFMDALISTTKTTS